MRVWDQGQAEKERKKMRGYRPSFDQPRTEVCAEFKSPMYAAELKSEPKPPPNGEPMLPTPTEPPPRLPEVVTESVAEHPILDIIAGDACRWARITRATFSGDTRAPDAVLARRVACLLARDYDNHWRRWSLPDIALAFGRTNHSTVLTQLQRARARAPICMPGRTVIYAGKSVIDVADQIAKSHGWKHTPEPEWTGGEKWTKPAARARKADDFRALPSTRNKRQEQCGDGQRLSAAQ